MVAQYSQYRISSWVSNKKINLFRLFILIIGIISLVIDQIIECSQGSCFGWYKFFSVQVHYFAVIWLSLALYWRSDPDRIKQLNGLIKGGIVTYLTIISIVYHFLLAPTSNFVGLQIYTTKITHYLLPLGMLIDWTLTERTNYKWKWCLVWLSYPLLFTIWGLIYLKIFDQSIYFFLNYHKLGILGFLQWFGILLGGFLLVGSIYFMLNQQLTSKK